jgi:Neuraminidase-like domain
VQMGSCMQTSRTKQAISSVQLFVQRCFLGLEKIKKANIVLDAERWKWMSKQTIWTANRKVFLYPENWLIPSLRDKKTPIYNDLENTLLQRDVKSENILESFRGFVTGLADIARLKAVGVYVELLDKPDYNFHCLAMTPGAPYIFFYRKYISANREWTSWIRVTADIPTYSVEWQESRSVPLMLTEGGTTIAAASDSMTNESFRVSTGCYAIPVAWKSRTLVFIGDIAKKTVPNDNALKTSFGQFTRPDSTASAEDIAPFEVFEIGLAWTEYRSGKWTQKQVATERFRTSTTEFGILPELDAFQFMPSFDTVNDRVVIEVWYYASDSSTKVSYAGSFGFNGIVLQQIRQDTATRPSNWTTTSFHLSEKSSTYTTHSLQVEVVNGTKTMTFIDKAPFVSYSVDSNGLVTYMDTATDLFYHPFPTSLITSASSSTDDTGIAPIEGVYRTLPKQHIAPAFGVVPANLVQPGETVAPDQVFAELSKPYTAYNWELGFHGPMQVAEALLKSQQFDQALAMLQQIFNPYVEGGDIRLAWKWYPFQHSSSDRILEGILRRLKPRQFDKRITDWRENPFQPFVVARGRIVAYMKWTVMTYIKTLIAYGDMYFRRRTLEDIPLAIQLYVLASHLYGTKGETIPKRGKKIPQTYFSLLNKWDAFSNAAVQLEISFPFSNQTTLGWHILDDGDETAKKGVPQVVLANIFGFTTSSYFCLPSNPNLQALRTTIDQRLFNIRNCLDIDGRPMPLVLWDPPIDPAQLVAAVASGLSLSSALNDLNASMPNYRFTWLLSRALEMTSELKSLESTFLAIKEKRDSEALQMLRSRHEVTVQKMVMELKTLQLEEAMKTLTALKAGQEVGYGVSLKG